MRFHFSQLLTASYFLTYVSLSHPYNLSLRLIGHGLMRGPAILTQAEGILSTVPNVSPIRASEAVSRKQADQLSGKKSP
jgi:hypothetical protein